MALIASSNTLHPPSWDETIVPALRKRLESESRTLSKRMSAISATSVEAPSALYIPPTADTAFRERTISPTTPTYSSKGSAIPRPSFPRASTDSRPDINGSPRLNGTPPVNGTPPIKPRSRTNSQPYSFDPSHSTNRSIDAKPYTNGISSVNPPESPHSPSSYNGRASDVRPTRIPKVALGRNASVSSHRHFPSSSLVSDSRNGYSLSSLTPSEPSHDSRMAEETSYSNYSRSIVSVGSQQQSRLLHELPPFQAGSRSSATHSFDHSEEDDAIIGRRSNDSDERPFEHWYRGEISRNGGVGELRVAKRQEMLDIANYGHTIRKITPHLLPRDLPPVDDMVRRRKRADSVTGIGDRESFYMDEQRAQEVGRVMDEGPLTDLDLDEDSDYSMSMRYDATAATVTAQSRLRNVTPTSLHSSSRQQSLPPTRIPGPVPSRQSSEPPRVPALPPTQRGASEPPSFPSTTSLPVSAMGPRSASQPLTQDQTTKRRAKSPAASTSASKRSKATALSIASKRAAENDKNRMSVACYPTPEDGVDVVNAIPSWTQPIPHLGNWDEVVLPVVARKKGLEGQYEKAGGSPPRKLNNIVEPAPGTFRFDPSKYRIPPSDDIPMDEFGQSPDKSEGNKTRQPERAAGPPYHKPGDTMTIPRPTHTDRDRERQVAEKDDAGCCKCVIM